MIKISSYFVLLILLPSCAGSKYKLPHHTMPQQFEFQYTALKKEENLAAWWQNFKDPTLNSLIEQALENNYALRIAIEKIEEARAFYRIKRAELFPQIDVVTQINRTRVSEVLQQTSFITSNPTSFFQYGFDGLWEIDFWGRIWHAKNARYFAMQAQIEEMRDIYIILLADVTRTYIDICALQKKLKLVCQQVNFDTQLVILQKDLFTAGLTSDIELAEQQQILATSQDQFKTLQTELAQSKNQLGVLLGMNPEDMRIGPCDAVPLSQVELTVGIPSEILRRRPDIRRAERLVASAHESVGQAIAEWFPHFTLFGGITTEASKGSNWFSGDSLTWHIGPSISWPFINFGTVTANINVKKSAERQTLLEYSQTIINALKEIEDFLVAYFNNTKQRSILANKLTYAIKQQDLVLVKFVSGLASKLDALNAQKNRITSELQFIDIQQLLSTNLVSLYKALGGGW